MKDKVLTLNGSQGACWGPSSSTWGFTGTLDEAKKYFSKHLSPNYQIRSGKDYSSLVNAEFYQKLGEYLYLNLEQDDVLNMVGTLKNLNRHLINTGRLKIEEDHDWFFAYDILESQNFKYADPKSERLNLFIGVNSGKLDGDFPKERIKEATYWILSSKYFPHRNLFDHENNLREKYPGLVGKVKELWDNEVCEKSIFPFLEKYYSENQ